jgi:hypothetical protein
LSSKFSAYFYSSAEFYNFFFILPIAIFWRSVFLSVNRFAIDSFVVFLFKNLLDLLTNI